MLVLECGRRLRPRSPIFADDFDPDTAELSDPPVRIVLGFNETVGTLVKNDLLNRDLVYDWLWVAGSWDRVGPADLRARERTASPICTRTSRHPPQGSPDPTLAFRQRSSAGTPWLPRICEISPA